MGNNIIAKRKCVVCGNEYPITTHKSVKERENIQCCSRKCGVAKAKMKGNKFVLRYKEPVYD